jgi:hypothetical protein
MRTTASVFNTLHDEFLLIGPLGERDKILARSDAVGMDLIGYAMDKDDSDEDRSGSTSVFDMYFGFLASKRQLHRVSSWPVQNPEPEEDSRKSSYRFAWVGKCSRYDLLSIKKSFNANILDISRAISEDDHEQLELSLAPILLRCSKANESFRRRQRLMRAFMILYLAIFAFAFFVLRLQEIIQRLQQPN